MDSEEHTPFLDPGTKSPTPPKEGSKISSSKRFGVAFLALTVLFYCFVTIPKNLRLQRSLSNHNQILSDLRVELPRAKSNLALFNEEKFPPQEKTFAAAENQKTNFAEEREMIISQCGSCSKRVPATPVLDDPGYGPRNTTCDPSTWVRGPGQRVVAYTYFEHPAKAAKSKERNYLKGIRENLELIKKHYPGFTMRLYYQVPETSESGVMDELCELACKEPMFDLCNAADNPRLGNMTVLYPLLWRFMPVLDLQVRNISGKTTDNISHFCQLVT